MSDTRHLLPQAERLLRRIEGLELPLVELWGWPGSGTSALLRALLARPDVIGLPLADLAVEEAARAAVAAAAGARWLVVAGDPGERLDALASWLVPGQQVVFASRRRRTGGPLAMALLPPQELLLTVAETARLWHLVCGEAPAAATAQALWRASDGWFQPLRLALEATGGTGLGAASAEQLLEIPAVRLFLRHEVLDVLPETAREQLLVAPRERPLAGERGGHEPRAPAATAGGDGGAREGPQAARDDGGDFRGEAVGDPAAASPAGHSAVRPAVAPAASLAAPSATSSAAHPAAGSAAGPAGERHEAGDGGGPARAAWQVIDELGLWVEGGYRDRLPSLLAAWLARERRRRHPPRVEASRAPRVRMALELGDAGGEPRTWTTGTVAGGAGTDGGVAGAADAAGVEAGSARQGGAAARPAAARAAAPRPTYEVRLLGGPLVRQRSADGEREVIWKLRRSFEVLAFLASSPDLQAAREDLEEAVWPTDGERTIDRNFHPTLSHLRRALERRRPGSVPQPLLFRGGIYRLNSEIEWDIDLQAFNRQVAAGRELLASGDQRAAAGAWQRAWKLYRGPFLQGYYQAWVISRREQCQQTYVELLRDLGDLAVRLERSEDALDAYRSVLLEDPLQERTHLAVMRLYAGQGRRDLVRRQYDRLCTLLLDELGVEPLPETVQEYHRLMS
jgi:DNA-binding SARP family transcriptional activator